jgi:hypothetical protein
VVRNKGRRLFYEAPPPNIRPFVYSCRRCPDSVHFKIKPVIGATYTTLKEKLAGISKDFQAVDASDLDYTAISGAL